MPPGQSRDNGPIQGRVPDCLGGLSRVGISSRSTRPWNGQPPSYHYMCYSYPHMAVPLQSFFCTFLGRLHHSCCPSNVFTSDHIPPCHSAHPSQHPHLIYFQSCFLFSCCNLFTTISMCQVFLLSDTFIIYSVDWFFVQVS